VILALVIAVALLLVVALVATRRRPPAVITVEPAVEPPPVLALREAPLPVVLVHGLFGFDRIGVPGARFDYFRGIAKHLDGLGCHAHAVRLPPAASVPDRAQELCDAIAALGHARVDVIAHSLGGLDARYAIAKLGLAARVRCLVTIGTPHRGTPIADIVGTSRARKIVKALGIPLHALDWLSTEGLAKFNADVLDVPSVRYACVVGGIRSADTPVPLPLVPAEAYLRKVSGANDGLVPVSSQYWGEVFAEIEADHLSQIGWRVSVRRTFDALGLYAFLVSRLSQVTGAPAPSPAAATSAR